MKTNNKDSDKRYDKEFGHLGELWNGKKGLPNGMTVKSFLHQELDREVEVAKKAIKENYIAGYKQGVAEQRLINIVELDRARKEIARQLELTLLYHQKEIDDIGDDAEPLTSKIRAFIRQELDTLNK